MKRKFFLERLFFEVPSLGGKIASSRLLLYYHGLVVGEPLVVGSGPELSAGALECIEQFVSALGYLTISFYHRDLLRDFRVFMRKGWELHFGYTYVVPLGGSSTDLLGKVDKNQRRLIRRAEKKGYVLSEDDDFESFYKQHCEIHHRKGAPVYLDRPRFEVFFRELKSKGLCRLFHTRTEHGESVASQLVLVSDHPDTHTVSAGAMQQFLGDGTTPFLRFKVLEKLAGEGFRSNDLTDALVPSVARFKREMGAELRQCARVSKVFASGMSARELGFRVVNKIRKSIGQNYYQ